MTRRLALLVLITLTTFSSFAQDRYIVRFTDKNNSPFSLSSPLQFLNQRSLDRRTKQNIPLDQFDLPVNPSYVAGVAATGASILNVTKWFNAVIIQTTNPAVLTAISQLSYVVSTNAVGKKRATVGPDKFSAEKTIPLKDKSIVSARTASYNYGNATNQTTMIGIDAVHNMGYSGENMIIAVLDAGFLDADQMACFDSLFADNRIISTWDFVDHETNVYNDHYHGSCVLSCMAANVPGDMVGTAPKASYILLRSEDANTENIIEEYNWSCAAEYADSAGADVITTSLGYTEFDNGLNNHTNADMDGNTCPSSIAADMAAKKGIAVCASAGNEGASPWHYVGTPGDADSILTVGAVDYQGLYASFSSTGPSADGRIKPDVATEGLNAMLYSPYNPGPAITGSGTSFACPILAGAVACLWQSWPNKSNMEIVEAVRKSASIYNNPDSLLGYGIPNFNYAHSLLSIGEVSVPKDAVIHIFPNPWNGNAPIHLYYYSDTTQDVKISMVDMDGRLIFTRTQKVTGGIYTDIQVNEKLNSGVYLVRFETDKGIVSRRIVRE